MEGSSEESKMKMHALSSLWTCYEKLEERVFTDIGLAEEAKVHSLLLRGGVMGPLMGRSVQRHQEVRTVQTQAFKLWSKHTTLTRKTKAAIVALRGQMAVSVETNKGLLAGASSDFLNMIAMMEGGETPQ